MPGLTKEEKQTRLSQPVISATGPPKKVNRKKRTFDEFFQALVEYKTKHGDCNVPLRYKDDSALGFFVSNLRRGAKPVTEEQRHRITNIGFDWETLNEKQERQWQENFAKLKVYKLKYGDSHVPQGWKDDPSLANWVGCQRKKQGKGKLLKHREARLNFINFRWSQSKGPRKTTSYDLKWMEKYTELLEFKKATGHTMVPVFWKKNKSLGQWVGRLRTHYAQNNISQDRVDLLDDIGFVWRINSADASNSLSQRKWDKMFCHLETFKRTYGHVEVHTSYQLNGLGTWLAVQRHDRGRVE